MKQIKKISWYFIPWNRFLKHVPLMYIHCAIKYAISFLKYDTFAFDAYYMHASDIFFISSYLSEENNFNEVGVITLINWYFIF